MGYRLEATRGVTAYRLTQVAGYCFVRAERREAAGDLDGAIAILDTAEILIGRADEMRGIAAEVGPVSLDKKRELITRRDALRRAG